MVEDEDFEKIDLASSQLGFGATPIDSVPYLNQDINRRPQVSTPTVTSVSPGTFGGTTTTTTTTTTTSFKPSSTNGTEVTVMVDSGNEKRSHNTPWQQGMTVYDTMKILKETDDLTFEESWHEGSGYYLTKLNRGTGDWTYAINGEEGWGVSLELVRKNDVIGWVNFR